MAAAIHGRQGYFDGLALRIIGLCLGVITSETKFNWKKLLIEAIGFRITFVPSGSDTANAVKVIVSPLAKAFAKLDALVYVCLTTFELGKLSHSIFTGCVGLCASMVHHARFAKPKAEWKIGFILASVSPNMFLRRLKRKPWRVATKNFLLFVRDYLSDQSNFSVDFGRKAIQPENIYVSDAAVEKSIATLGGARIIQAVRDSTDKPKLVAWALETTVDDALYKLDAVKSISCPVTQKILVSALSNIQILELLACFFQRLECGDSTETAFLALEDNINTVWCLFKGHSRSIVMSIFYSFLCTILPTWPKDTIAAYTNTHANVCADDATRLSVSEFTAKYTQFGFDVEFQKRSAVNIFPPDFFRAFSDFVKKFPICRFIGAGKLEEAVKDGVHINLPKNLAVITEKIHNLTARCLKDQSNTVFVVFHPETENHFQARHVPRSDLAILFHITSHCNPSDMSKGDNSMFVNFAANDNFDSILAALLEILTNRYLVCRTGTTANFSDTRVRFASQKKICVIFNDLLFSDDKRAKQWQAITAIARDFESMAVTFRIVDKP